MSADPSFVLPLTADYDTADVIDALALARFATGGEPYCRSFELRKLPEDADLLVDGGVVVRQEVDDNSITLLARGEGWTMRLTRRANGRAWGAVTARSDDLAAEIAGLLSKQDAPPATRPGRITMGFWHRARDEGKRTRRLIDAPEWRAIRGNYSAPVASAVDRLMSMPQVDNGGRLILLHGPPGTGKSTVLRALALRWSDWCRVEYVIDPERLFGEPSYLLDLLLDEDRQRSFREDDDADEPRRWRLLIIEDCDELIRPGAKGATGQGLSRLLNITDGLVGQGLKVLVCITTNEELSRLHPAVTRPGRCLANIGFTPLSPAEARVWLAGAGVAGKIPAGGAALAELLQLRGDVETVSQVTDPERPGMYL